MSMGNEPMLAYTVHHKGHIYPAGSTAADIGPDAADIGAHAWEGGITPGAAAAPKQGDGEAPKQDDGEAPKQGDGDAPKRAAGGNRRSGNQG
jgi:hypothetical protein